MPTYKNTPMNAVITTSLYFREGNSDKEYHVHIEPQEAGYIVTFAYGRRGSTLTSGSKTPDLVTLAEAKVIHDKLVREKAAKGYRTNGQSSTPYQQCGEEGHDSGIRCQLLNPVDKSELRRLLGNDTHCLQQKYDGRRLMVRKTGSKIIGINRKGMIVAIPNPIRQAVEAIDTDCLIDGEAVGDVLHVFDLLEHAGIDARQTSYLNRHSELMRLLAYESPALSLVRSIYESDEKLEIFRSLRENGVEGVVFKEWNAPFCPGRPNSGGSQLKFKFVESASFVVTSHNDKRSVSLGLYDGDKLVPVGNVTIPPNHAVPAVGEVCDARYLYAFRESGVIYQPVYIGKRCDISASECVTDQLKYKVDAA